MNTFISDVFTPRRPNCVETLKMIEIDLKYGARHERDMLSNVFVFNRRVHPVAQSTSGKCTLLNTILMVLEQE